MTKPVFDCQRCSDCCTGEGGIFLTKEQVSVAAAILELDPTEFVRLYLRLQGGRFAVLCENDGRCRLLGPRGCRIHAAKPDICRRWPFFDALIKDAGAFEEAKMACPGLDPAASHADFLAQARRERDVT
jgi:Fe-S-cluster containining protein